MSANPVIIPEIEAAEPYQECLLDRIARGRLPLAETLAHVFRLARTLKDLHAQGLAYGAVSSPLVLLGPAGAELRNSIGLMRLGEPAGDVTGLGKLLEEMLGHTDGPAEFLEELRALAIHCQTETPDMRQVVIALRLVGIRMRQSAGPVLRPVLVPLPRPEPEEPKTSFVNSLRASLNAVLTWKPLANFATLRRALPES